MRCAVKFLHLIRPFMVFIPEISNPERKVRCACLGRLCTHCMERKRRESGRGGFEGWHPGLWGVDNILSCSPARAAAHPPSSLQRQ